MPRSRGFVGVAGLGLVLLVVTAGASCSAGGWYAAPSVTTLMAGWETHFTLDWTVEPEGGNARLVRGYVASRHGQHAESVRILARALDGSGAVVGQRLAWIPGGVPGLGRAYFEVSRLPAADRYAVSVWDYTFLESDGRGALRRDPSPRAAALLGADSGPDAAEVFVDVVDEDPLHGLLGGHRRHPGEDGPAPVELGV